MLLYYPKTAKQSFTYNDCFDELDYGRGVYMYESAQACNTYAVGTRHTTDIGTYVLNLERAIINCNIRDLTLGDWEGWFNLIRETRLQLIDCYAVSCQIIKAPAVTKELVSLLNKYTIGRASKEEVINYAKTIKDSVYVFLTEEAYKYLEIAKNLNVTEDTGEEQEAMVLSISAIYNLMYERTKLSAEDFVKVFYNSKLFSDMRFAPYIKYKTTQDLVQKLLGENLQLQEGKAERLTRIDYFFRALEELRKEYGIIRYFTHDVCGYGIVSLLQESLKSTVEVEKLLEVANAKLNSVTNLKSR